MLLQFKPVLDFQDFSNGRWLPAAPNPTRAGLFPHASALSQLSTSCNPSSPSQRAPLGISQAVALSLAAYPGLLSSVPTSRVHCPFDERHLTTARYNLNQSRVS